MNGFFQLFTAWGVLLAVILALYLIDKVNTIYAASVPSEKPKVFSDGLFGELQGKTLWDAMSGIPLPGLDLKLVNDLRVHYEPVLRQHIEATFAEGYQDGRRSRPGMPTNNRMIPTPRGKVESWIPVHHLASLYQAGEDFATKPEDSYLRIQQNLDQVISMLYARTGLSLTEPYSTHLLKHPADSEPGGPVANLPPEMRPVLEAADQGLAKPLLAAAEYTADPNLVTSRDVVQRGVERSAAAAMPAAEPAPETQADNGLAPDLMQPQLNMPQAEPARPQPSEGRRPFKFVQLTPNHSGKLKTTWSDRHESKHESH